MSSTIQTVLVLGDLHLDVRVTDVAEGTFPTALNCPVGDDFAIESSMSIKAGGSSLSFARALAAETQWTPLVLGSTGSDSSGDLLESAVIESAPLSRILRTADDPQSITFAMWDSEGQRFMIRPNETANASLAVQDIRQYIYDLEAAELTPRACFLSGYTLLHPAAPRFAAAKWAIDWCRDNAVGLILDLVPHDFLTSVGTLDFIEELTGAHVVIVGEYFTMRDLLDLPRTAEIGHPELEEVTRQLGQVFRVPLVQHRLNPTTYSQATMDDMGSPVVQLFNINDQDSISGQGDLMLARHLDTALRQLDVKKR